MGLRAKNWAEWQTYRNDRGTPPWIKVYRNLMSNPDWSMMSDAEKGQLVSIWLIAADNKGELPDNGKVLRKICLLDDIPDINKFIELGFLERFGCHGDTQVVTTCPQDDAPEKRREEKRRVDKIRKDTCPEAKTSRPDCSENSVMIFPIIGKVKEYSITEADVREWQETFLGVDVLAELRKCRQWNVDYPTRRKTANGIKGHISTWLGKAQDSSRGRPAATGAAGNKALSPRDKRNQFVDEEQRKIKKGLEDGTINFGFSGSGGVPALPALPE